MTARTSSLLAQKNGAWDTFTKFIKLRPGPINGNLKLQAKTFLA